MQALNNKSLVRVAVFALRSKHALTDISIADVVKNRAPRVTKRRAHSLSDRHLNNCDVPK